VKSDFPELLIKPLMFLALIAVMVVLFPAYLSVYSIMGIYVLTVGVAAWVGARQLLTTLPIETKKAPAFYQTEQWFRGSLPFLMIVAMFAINQQIDVLMLGAIQGTSAAGIYTVIGRGAQLIQFSLAAVSSATGPTIAQLYAVQNLAQVERVTHNSARLLWCACAGISTSLIAVGYWFLLIFGAEFVQGQTALTILCLGYMLSAPFELAGLLLLMTGRERDTAIGTGITALLNVILNSLLIPRFGLEGAAFATATSLVMRGLFFSFRTYQTLKIVPNPLKFSSGDSAIRTSPTKTSALSRVLSSFHRKQFHPSKQRHSDISIDASARLTYQDSQSIKIGSRVRIGALSELTTATDGGYPGRLTIAGGTTIGRQARLTAIGERIFIGQNCQIGDRVTLIANRSDRTFPLSDPAIYLNDGVWLGAGTIVHLGCAIGENSIVGSDSVVTDDIPANEVWAGDPARKICDRKGLSIEDIATLLEAR
ncbi:polysaccharide biosynthesis C-terminal domain-containing protein, partial [Pseudanabaenaceae cyanobacterium LEGE 13415]|nr:polysaccharide biosynthesis C-terminal domain-containing protein [Pseudanabaenaceae cyanobacterium LEGE 13415]